MQILKRENLTAQNLEKYYFYFFLALNLVPVLCFKFFPTVDGPAHLYNSALIVELLSSSESPIHDFLVFNSSINPNWSGHFLLALFSGFLPAFVAEKIVLLIYLVGFPLSVRYLFHVLGIKTKYLLYLVFPFTYSYLFYYGFYNFNIGVVLFFFGIGLALKYKNQFTRSRVVKLLLVSTLICFSHLFVFAVFLMVLFFVNADSLMLLFNINKEVKRRGRNTILGLLIAVLPGLFITFNFLFANESMQSVSVYLPFSDLLASLKYIMPAKGIAYDGYGLYNRVLLYLFVALIACTIISVVYHLVKNKKWSLKNNAWLIVLVTTGLLIFILPDYKGAAIGFVSSRLMFFFFIFLIIWLASQEISKWVIAAVFIGINLVNIGILYHNYQSVKAGCELAEEIRATAEFIEPNSTVLPLTYSDNLLNAHISNYLGTEKPMIILENYEASLDHFPLRWNTEHMPELLVGDSLFSDMCYSWSPTGSQAAEAIDYVFIVADTWETLDPSCDISVDLVLQRCYDKVETGTSDRISLYKLKPGF
jgi:hypothetical protein